MPGLPLDEVDYFFAVFDERECRQFGPWAAHVTEYEGRFPVPKIWADNPETAQAWEDEVRGRLAEFARLRDLGLPNLRLITFIG